LKRFAAKWRTVVRRLEGGCREVAEDRVAIINGHGNFFSVVQCIPNFQY